RWIGFSRFKISGRICPFVRKSTSRQAYFHFVSIADGGIREVDHGSGKTQLIDQDTIDAHCKMRFPVRITRIVATYRYGGGDLQVIPRQVGIGYREFIIRTEYIIRRIFPFESPRPIIGPGTSRFVDRNQGKLTIGPYHGTVATFRFDIEDTVSFYAMKNPHRIPADKAVVVHYLFYVGKVTCDGLRIVQNPDPRQVRTRY